LKDSFITFKQVT